MKNKMKVFLSVLLIGILASFPGCFDSSNDDEEEKIRYAVGDTGPSGVGIVFYITDGGLHGLEAAPDDQSISQAWIEGGITKTTLNGNTSTEIGTGLANSNAIIAQEGHTNSAAKLCRDYKGGGLTDWFLPSNDELAWLALNADTIGNFSNNIYWSSSESKLGSDGAWCCSFEIIIRQVHNKNSEHWVRAVRAF